MRTRTILLIGTLLFFCFAGIRANLTAAQGNGAGANPNTKAQGKPTPYPTYNVTSTVYDFDSLSNPLQLQSDDLNPNLTGTGGLYGIYKTDSSTNVISRIDDDSCSNSNNCDWGLYMDNSTSRSYRFTLSRLSGSGPTGTYSLHGHLHSVCFDPTGATTNTVNWFNITTSDPNCSMRAVFTLNKTNYVLVMSPRWDSPQPTGRAIVTCTQVSGSSCFGWTIAPNLTQSTTNPNPTVANLYSLNRNGTLNFIGQYALTYSVNVTYP